MYVSQNAQITYLHQTGHFFQGVGLRTELKAADLRGTILCDLRLTCKFDQFQVLYREKRNLPASDSTQVHFAEKLGEIAFESDPNLEKR